MVIEGQAVKAGDNLFQIADRRLLWMVRDATGWRYLYRGDCS